MIVLRAVLLRAALLAAGWWILTEGSRDGVAFGAAVVALALGVSLWLSPPAHQPWRPLGLARFAAFFLDRSVRGGLDVARRAFAPRLPLAPALRTYRGRLRPGPARDVFAAAISLMPGTLTVEHLERGLLVHVLVDSDHVERELAALEARIAHAMGVEDGDG